MMTTAAKLEAAFQRIRELEGLLDSRAGKLLKKGKRFVVVACDEPYYTFVYALIRYDEKAKNRWTEEDESCYCAACAAKGEGSQSWPDRFARMIHQLLVPEPSP